MRTLMTILSTFALVLLTPLSALAAPTVGTADGLAASGAAATSAHFTYEVEQRGDVRADFDEFAAHVTATLDDDRGWRQTGVAFQRVESGGDLKLVLASPEEVEAAHDVCTSEWSCRVGDEVLINDVRWRKGTEAWTGTVDGYRDYVVNHEVGHWLGLGHYDCPAAGETAPVMRQQSIDLQGCEPNGWPQQFEVDAVVDTNPAVPGRVLQPGHSVPGAVREATWLLRAAPRGGQADAEFSYGPGDGVAVTGDWNGDGRRTPGVFSDGVWRLRNAHRGGEADVELRFGRAGDIPVVGDWNGDGRDTPGVVRGRTWHLRNTLRAGRADVQFSYGHAGDAPVVGDWNGDGRDTPGVVRGRAWYLRQALGGGAAHVAFTYGHAGDAPVVGDWNGDGRDTPGVVRARTWYLRQALGGGAAHAAFTFGRAGDQPVVWR